MFNLSGYDDYNLLLFLTSPPLWILEQYTTFLGRYMSEETIIVVMRVVALIFWGYFGLLIDITFFPTRRAKLKQYFKILTIAILLLTILFILFYMQQNSEKQIKTIISNPEQYSDANVQQAIRKAVGEGYAEQHLSQLEAILQTTDDRGVLASTMSALAKIGTPEAILLIMQTYRDPLDILIHLQMNEPTIITMLDMKQSQDMIEGGIEAASLLNFESFVEPLRKLSESYPDEKVAQRAQEVLQQILLDPQHNNPKFYTD